MYGTARLTLHRIMALAGTLFFFCIYAPAADSSKYPKAEEWAVFMHKGDSIMTDFDDVRTENYPLLQSA